MRDASAPLPTETRAETLASFLTDLPAWATFAWIAGGGLLGFLLGPSVIWSPWFVEPHMHFPAGAFDAAVVLLVISAIARLLPNHRRK